MYRPYLKYRRLQLIRWLAHPLVVIASRPQNANRGVWGRINYWHYFKVELVLYDLSRQRRLAGVSVRCGLWYSIGHWLGNRRMVRGCGLGRRVVMACNRRYRALLND